MNQGQGHIVDPATGRRWPIPAGGSGEDGGGDGGGQQQAQPDGDGFIEPYLEGIEDPQVRQVVEKRLSQARQDFDRNANRKIQEQAEALKQYRELGEPEDLQSAAQMYAWLLTEPQEAVSYVVDHYEGQGVDIRSHLMSQTASEQIDANRQQPAAAAPPPQDGGAASPPTAAAGQQQPDGGSPLTEDRIRQIVGEAVSQQQEKFAEQQRQQQQRAEVEKQVNVAVDEADTKHGLGLEGDDDPLRHTIIQNAYTLMRGGKTRSLAVAVDMAAETLANRIGSGGGQNTGGNGQQPNVAVGGGSPVSPPDVDLGDKTARRDAATQLLTQLNQTA